VAACAFYNTTSIPIILLSVLQQTLSRSIFAELASPLLFLSLQLLTYPLLQWLSSVALIEAYAHFAPRHSLAAGLATGRHGAAPPASTAALLELPPAREAGESEHCFRAFGESRRPEAGGRTAALLPLTGPSLLARQVLCPRASRRRRWRRGGEGRRAGAGAGR
jgi:hypothetical protein